MARSKTDVRILFCTRIVRLFAYGFLSVTLVLYLAELGIAARVVGLLLTLALLGDILISLALTTSADRLGRRRVLVVGALLLVLAGTVFAITGNVFLLAAAAIVGVVSPSGNEIGPFLSIEQAALSETTADRKRTRVLAWYHLAGSLATASGALLGGGFVQALQRAGFSELASYRFALLVYAAAGIALALLFLCLSPEVEASRPTFTISKRRFGLHRSRNTVTKLSGLFALDAFAGGFVIQTLVAYWFYRRFGAEPMILGAIFFGSNALGGFSGLVAERLAARIGLVNTMVFTHIPSNVLLMLVPFMPNLASAIAVLLLRSSISQMDVPTRQSYTMAVVTPDERSAAAGVTTTARSIGALISPVLSGQLFGSPLLMSTPFCLAGGLKIIYDLWLYRSFRKLRSPEEAVTR